MIKTKEGIAILPTLEDACAVVAIVPKHDCRRKVFISTNTVDGRGRPGAGRIIFFSDGTGGMVFNHRTKERALFFYDINQGMTEKERASMQRKARAERAQAELEASVRQQQRGKILPGVITKMFSHTFVGVHPYLLRKMVADVPGAPTAIISKAAAQAALDQVPPGIYEDGCLMSSLSSLSGDLLMVALTDTKGAVCSCQFIDEKGRKRLMKGAPKMGLIWRPSELPVYSQEVCCVCIAEGVATALSVRALFNVPCVAAIDCHNIEGALNHVLHSYPHAEINVMADRDKSTKEYPEGVGLFEAKRAVELLSEHSRERVKIYCVPPVTDCQLFRFRTVTENPEGEITDFNDYQIAISQP